MIKISDDNDCVLVIGHASDKEHKKCDESQQACASITALTQTLIRAIEEKCGEVPDYELKKGYFKLDKKHLSGHALFLVDVFLLGCQYVQIGYPDYIFVQA